MMSESDYEDDFDADLPPISLSQTSGEKTELQMPSAEEVASRRAREAAAERALQEVRDSYVAPAPAPAPRCSDDGEPEAKRARAAAPAAAAELAALAAALPRAEGAVLLEYSRALAAEPHAAAAITHQLVSGVCRALSRGALARGGVLAAAGALLCAPPSLRAARALHALLDRVAEPEQVLVLSRAVARARPGAARRLAAADAARSGARAGADRLAAALLAAAVSAALGEEDSDEPASPLSAHTVSLVHARWRRLAARRRTPLLRAAGRALAGEAAGAGEAGGAGGERGDGGGGAALLRALAVPLPRAPAFALHRQQVLASVSKLQLLFLTRAGDHDDDDDGDDVFPPALLQQAMRVGGETGEALGLEDIEDLKQEVIQELKEEMEELVVQEPAQRCSPRLARAT